jgi:hypothetical protein
MMAMRRPWLEILAALLLIGSLFFFYRSVTALEQHDYVAAILLMFIGFAVIRVGSDLCRLALADRV